MTAKLLFFGAPFFVAFQGAGGAAPTGTFERLMNISVAIFIMAVGLYVLWKQFQKESDYVKDQAGELREIVGRVSSIAESSSRAVQNSTEAMRDISQTLSEFSKEIEQLQKERDAREKEKSENG